MLKSIVTSEFVNRGGHAGDGKSEEGENGTISGIDCPPGLHGIFCKVISLLVFW